jgi:hypothetical protein
MALWLTIATLGLILVLGAARPRPVPALARRCDGRARARQR